MVSKYQRDISAIRRANAACTILTCHDEYVLASMVQGVDGALVGFASFIPELLTALYRAVCEGDLRTAQEIQRRIDGLKEVVYANEEPSGEAHARMKTAMMLSGRLKSDAVRAPFRPPGPEVQKRIQAALEAANLEPGPLSAGDR